MLNGRHLLLLGGITAAGLLSVREGERQVGLCYQIATVEKDIRGVRAQIKLCKNEHLALQSPKAVMDRAAELHLALAPIPPGAQTAVMPQPTANPNSPSANRRPQNAPPAPTIPALPGVPPLDHR
ncbi:MAG TPA: hypothetical protein VKX17_26895 [Planctomycetota bacterium]|nr:hypothetical protein [Planctomycetota bacterium]